MKDKKRISNEKTILILIICLFLIFFYFILYYLNWDLVHSYDDVVLPSFKVNQFDISGLSFEHSEKKIELLSKEILKEKINVSFEGKEYLYSLGDLGLEVDVSKTMKDVVQYQKHLSFSRKLWYINDHNDEKVFKVYYIVHDEKALSFLNQFNQVAGVAPQNGFFDASEGVRYVAGVDGYRVNINSSLEFIHDYFNDQYDPKLLNFHLVGEKIPAYTNESYKSIDTMTSSFVTSYDTWIYARAQNLRVAINYINGAIVEPGEIFSYFDYAGPYDKEGYVFYYEFVGNGVCQVATTVYNAALLGGLEIVKRYPHKKKSVYVAGGLDATVASYSSGWNVDMQWKNTYDYPIYVKAYDWDGEVHVEFWSNHDATGGKTYSTESVWLGGRSYQTFLHTYLNGEEIDRSFIDSTYYLED